MGTGPRPCLSDLTGGVRQGSDARRSGGSVSSVASARRRHQYSGSRPARGAGRAVAGLPVVLRWSGIGAGCRSPIRLAVASARWAWVGLKYCWEAVPSVLPRTMCAPSWSAIAAGRCLDEPVDLRRIVASSPTPAAFARRVPPSTPDAAHDLLRIAGGPKWPCSWTTRPQFARCQPMHAVHLRAARVWSTPGRLS